MKKSIIVLMIYLSFPQIASAQEEPIEEMSSAPALVELDRSELRREAREAIFSFLRERSTCSDFLLIETPDPGDLPPWQFSVEMCGTTRYLTVTENMEVSFRFELETRDTIHRRHAANHISANRRPLHEVWGTGLAFFIVGYGFALTGLTGMGLGGDNNSIYAPVPLGGGIASGLGILNNTATSSLDGYGVSAILGSVFQILGMFMILVGSAVRVDVPNSLSFNGSELMINF